MDSTKEMMLQLEMYTPGCFTVFIASDSDPPQQATLDPDVFTKSCTHNQPRHIKHTFNEMANFIDLISSTITLNNPVSKHLTKYPY